MFSPIKNPPVQLENVEREHFANASQFLGAIRIAPFQLQTCELFERLCRRCESDLDALRIADDQAVKIGQAALEVDVEMVSVVALLLAESESGRLLASEQSVGMLHHESPEIRQAAWWGLRLASSRHVEPHLRALLGKPKWDFSSAAALDILAFHRLPVQGEFGKPPDKETDEIAWLLAEATGRICGIWNFTHFNPFLGHASPRVREAALRASARRGLAELVGYCREAVRNSGPVETIEFLGVVGTHEDISRLQSAASNRVTATAALKGLGRLGLSVGVPVLLEFLGDPELEETAAAAIERITGLEVPRGELPKPPADLNEDDLDLWEPQAPVDISGTRDWWKANASRFDPSKRWQAGLCVSDDPLGPVFDQLPLAIRYDVYLRERALTPGTPDWELETWPWKQKNPGG